MPREEISYLVPEVELTVSQAWITLIAHCQENIPYGDIYIEINNCQPSKRLKEIPSIRFDVQPRTKEGLTYVIESLDMRIPRAWVDLIQWCQGYFNSGRLGFRLAAAQPTELLQAKHNVNFSKPETVPAGSVLDFIRS